MKENVKKMHFNNKKTEWTKQRKLLAATGGVVVLAFIAGAIALNTGKEETYVYKETEVKYGNLVVGVTQDGAVDIGTVEQTFDLDMSALQRVEISNTGLSSGSGSGTNDGSNSASGGGMSSGGAMSGAGSLGTAMSGAFGAAMSGGGMPSGMDMFSQMLGLSNGGNNMPAQDASGLEISEVCVSVGQQVAQGDVLYVLKEESVKELEQELQSNVEKAEADLNAVYADQKLSKQEAAYNLESSTAYGSYAQTEYDISVQELEDTVQKKQKALTQAQQNLTDYQEQLASITDSYGQYAQALANCQWSLNNTNQEEDVFGYVYYFELTQEAQSAMDSVEKQKEQLEKNVEQAEENVALAEKEYNSARRNLAQGLLSAQQTLSLRQLAYNTAQETYDIAMAYLEEDVSGQELVYTEAQEKWEEFSSHISGNNVCARYDGVITSVDLAAGDSIRTGDVLVTLYNREEVTMTVTVDEADMTDIAVDSLANITFIAYPETVFTARVTEISEASADASGNVTYDVTVTLQGDVSVLFQGMTGEITFVTEETKDVLYVSRRAITTSGDQSYVKVRNEKGNIETKEVTTGFTDGVNIEIVEGLSEGDIVLIESKVNNA